MMMFNVFLPRAPQASATQLERYLAEATARGLLGSSPSRGASERDGRGRAGALLG
jgi:hypothetical protein